MKKIIMIAMMFLSTQALSKVDTSAKTENTKTAYSKIVKVHGMVCAFCSNSLEKKFKKKKAIEDINVDLEEKLVKIKFKKGKSIPDKKIKKMIKSSGFKVVSINDSKKSGDKLDKK